MVDFAKLLQEMREKATPEERARMDAYEKREARYEATAREINASFAAIGERYVTPGGGGFKLTAKPQKKEYEQYVMREWQKPIKMRMEDGIIHFIGGSTGYERFEVSEEMVENLQKWCDEGHFEWSICGGSPRYNRCSVDIRDVLEYLREQRPELFREVSPALSM